MLLDFYEERLNWLEPGREESNDVAVRPADSQHGHDANAQGKTRKARPQVVRQMQDGGKQGKARAKGKSQRGNENKMRQPLVGHQAVEDQSS